MDSFFISHQCFSSRLCW